MCRWVKREGCGLCLAGVTGVCVCPGVLEWALASISATQKAHISGKDQLISPAANQIMLSPELGDLGITSH